MAVSDDGLQRRKEIAEQAIIFRKNSLTPFQVRVNEAAIELALLQPTLIAKGNRGSLLEKARKKVAEDGYTFKKGSSRSKVYGTSSNGKSASKRTKINQELREQRLKELEEDISDVSSHIAYKEKRLKAVELLKDYKACDKISEELMDGKSRKRELETELKLLLQKDRRAKKRLGVIHQDKIIRSSTPMSSSSSSIMSISSIPQDNEHSVSTDSIDCSQSLIVSENSGECTSGKDLPNEPHSQDSHF